MLLHSLYSLKTLRSPISLKHLRFAGPFQHKVDDGAELRKLALACMDTLLDKVPEKLDTSAFLQHLQARLLFSNIRKNSRNLFDIDRSATEVGGADSMDVRNG